MKPSGVTSIETFSSKASAAGPLEEGGDAAAAQLAARLRLLAARGEAVPVGERQALVEDLLERAAVVGLAHRVRVGHLLGPDHVAPAQRRRIHLHLARRRVHQPLDQVDRLRPAGAAVRAGRRGVGQHRGEVQVDRRHVVDAGRDPRADQQLDRDAGRRRVGADVGERLHAQRQHPAVGVERELGVAGDVAAVIRREELLAALGLPAHRALQRPRRVGDDQVFRIRRRSSCRSRRRRRRRGRAPAAARGRAASPAMPPATAGRHLVADAHLDPAARLVEAGDDRARLHRRPARGAGCGHRARPDARRGRTPASVAAASPWRISAAMLSGASAVTTRGARGAVAARASVTAGSSSRSRTIASIASRAWLARLGDHRGDRLADVARELVRQRAAQRR